MPKSTLAMCVRSFETDNIGKANSNHGWRIRIPLYLQHSRMPLLWDRQCGPKGPPLQSNLMNSLLIPLES